MHKQILISSLLTLGLATAFEHKAMAQYSGPTSNEITSVSSVLENGRDDQYIRLVGKITEQISEEKYMFADTTGEIRVEIDRDVFNVPVSENTTVEIRGEVEKDFMESIEIDVESLIVKD